MSQASDDRTSPGGRRVCPGAEGQDKAAVGGHRYGIEAMQVLVLGGVTPVFSTVSSALENARVASALAYARSSEVTCVRLVVCKTALPVAWQQDGFAREKHKIWKYRRYFPLTS